MAPCVPRSPLRAIALAGVTACLVLAAACVEDTPTGGDRSEIGVIEGRITEAGLPIAAGISFSNNQGDWPDVRVTVVADSTGWYRAELPLGLYRRSISVDNANTPCCSSADTVLVGRTVRRRDFALGRARLTITLPPVYDDRYAWLRIESPGLGNSYGVTVRDGAATYDLRLLPPGDYTMRVNPDGRMEYVHVPSDDDPARPDTLRVGAEAVTERTIDFRARHASITGRVNGGALLRDGAVRVEAVGATRGPRGSVPCDVNGFYRLDLLLPEPVRLRSSCGALIRWFGGDTVGDATLHDLQPGDDLTAVNQSAGVLRVRFDGPGDLVENEALAFMREEDGTETVLDLSPQNPLVVGNLRPGRIQLFVAGGCAGQPWQPQWYDGAQGVEDATFLDIVDGQVTDVAMTLTAGGTISGTLSYTGDPWSMSIALRGVDGGRICPTTVRPRNGKFELPGLPDGDYRLALYLGSSPWWYPGTWSLNEAALLSIVDGGTVSGLVWPLPFPYAKPAP